MRIFKRILFALLLLIVAVILVTTVQVGLLRFKNPESTAWMKMRVRDAKAQDQTLTIKHAWAPVAEIPRPMQLAVIMAEDEKFYRHSGFDWEALKKAYKRNEKLNRIKRGGSTITQQLAKNLYLSPGRSYWRKAREAWITMTMELMLPKDRILELYLNLVEFGPGVFGVEAAAQHHFGVSVKQLSVNQACRLASILPRPLGYKIDGNYVTKRAAILQRIISGPASVERVEAPQIEKPETQPPPIDQIVDSLLRELDKSEQLEDTLSQ